jgi:hypothetical protein
MGRPLNKKYFGNRNTGSTTTTADDGIGGKGVASIPVTSAGSYTVRPVVTLTGAPNLLSGVAATATITSQVNIISSFVGGTNYTTGDTFTIGNGTVFTVGTVNGSGVIQTITTTERGSFPYADGALVTGARATTIINSANPLATGATVTLTYNAKEVLITDAGSGYSTTVPTAAATQSVTLGTVVMTSPVGNTSATGTASNPDAGIIAKAFTGSSVKQADIVKQVSKNRYRINTSDTSGTPIVAALTTVTAAAVGEMTITAFDSAAKKYFVKKLTAHKAVIVPDLSDTGHLFPLINGEAQQVPWTLSAATSTTVQIENA